ncbi:MAG: hypothetical protein HY304_03705 [candidate division Zixibacteria bacterium]|nr:hypothetical protein [candidate division Zixibacteria bacterium]
MTDAEHAVAPGSPSGQIVDGECTAEDNWRILRAALIERIRRRALALQRLAPDTFATETVDVELAAIGDNANALWRLSERLDRALDFAFAPRARRISTTDTSGRNATRPSPDEFKAR